MVARDEERFARDAADVETCSAEFLVFLDDGGFQSELAGANGGDITARAGTDDDDVKFFHASGRDASPRRPIFSSSLQHT